MIGGCSKLTLLPSNVFHRMKDVFPKIYSQEFTASYQGVMQIVSLFVTLGIALGGGLIVGKNQVTRITSH